MYYSIKTHIKIHKHYKYSEIEMTYHLKNYSKKEVLREIMSSNTKIKEAQKDMDKIMQDEHDRYLAYMREKYIIEMDSMKNDGIQEGLRRGLKRGLKQGLERGRHEGRIDGLEKGRIMIAKKMKKAGITIDKIIECTGLSEKEIDNLDKA